jgi:hypothetical protein
MPSFVHGKSAVILFNGYDVSPFMRDTSSATTIETVETTAFGSSAKSYIVGKIDAGVSMGGMFEGDTSGSDAIFSALVGVEADNIVSIFPSGVGTVGNRAMLVAGKLVSYETTSPVGDVVSCSVEIQSNDGRDNGVMLAGSSISATGSGSSVDNTTSSTNGGVAHLNIPVNDRNGTIVVKVQHSSDNSTWVDLVTFSTVSSSTVASQRVEVTSTINRYIRANYTVNGSSGSATVYVAFARR